MTIFKRIFNNLTVLNNLFIIESKKNKQQRVLYLREKIKFVQTKSREMLQKNHSYRQKLLIISNIKHTLKINITVCDFQSFDVKCLNNILPILKQEADVYFKSMSTA